MSAEPTYHAGGADDMCPVCRWPRQGSAACERCGWERIEGFQPGLATAADRLRMEARLIDRQRDYDLRAAARAAAAAPGDPVLPKLLAVKVRGGPLMPGQIEQAVARVTVEEPLPVSQAGLVFALTRLVAGKTGAIAFVEIGPDDVSVQTLVADARGVPAPRAAESVGWNTILPSLPDHLGHRYLRMAGGIGTASAEREDEDPDPAALDAAVRDEHGAFSSVLVGFKEVAAKSAAIGGVGQAPGEPFAAFRRPADTVLVHRTSKWPLLDAAAARARAELRPVTEITVAPDSVDLAAVVSAAAARAPLRYGYDLILVDVDRGTGVVRPRSRELFPAGAAVSAGSPPVTTVIVSPVTDHAAEQVALPVVARRGPVADPRDVEALEMQRPLVAMAALDGVEGRPFQFRVRLAGPGLAEPLPSPRLLSADLMPVGWPGLMAELPDRLPPAGVSAPGGLDLVILVELGAAQGREAVVASRIRLARDLVQEFLTASAARIGVLGYREHSNYGAFRLSANGMPDQEDRAFVVGSVHGPRHPAETQAALQRAGRWQAVRLGDDHAAAVEEALEIVAGEGWGWRPGARHVVLIIGHRPPHPEEAGPHPDVMFPCPFGHSWRDQLARLRDGQSAECFAVLDRAPAPGYAEWAWGELTARGGWWLRRKVRAPELARAFGLTPSSARLRLATLAGVALSTAPEGEAAQWPRRRSR